MTTTCRSPWRAVELLPIISRSCSLRLSPVHSRRESRLRIGLELLLDTNPSNRAAALVGVAFEIADLLLLQAWAGFHGMQMIVELDHCVDGHEYEEIVAIYAKGTELRR